MSICKSTLLALIKASAGISGQTSHRGLCDVIDKWLKAGVMERGAVLPQSGSPQGGVISPILANVFLHHVLDEWFSLTRCKLDCGAQASPWCAIADDFVMLLAHREDAERVLEVLGKRLGKYGLQLHPDKTRMIDFRFRELSPRAVAENTEPWPRASTSSGLPTCGARRRRARRRCVKSHGQGPARTCGPSAQTISAG